MRIAVAFLSLSFLWLTVSANVEKTIFLGPPPSIAPATIPRPDDLGLARLSPSNPTLRAQLKASFSTDNSLYGDESWYFLENLAPGQRYEVRICYLATQPTAFTLTTYTLPLVIEESTLLESISRYSLSQLATAGAEPIVQEAIQERNTPSPDVTLESDSALFLRIRASADYFTLNKTLMENVQLVTADIILDPFLANIFPRSLVPTALWMILAAAAGLAVARWIAGEFERLALEETSDVIDQEAKKLK